MIIYRYLIFLLSILNHPFNQKHKLKTLVKILWWKINRIFFKLPCIVGLVSNIKIICYPDDSLYSTLVVYFRFPEYGEMQFLLNTLKNNDNFLDIGANMGVYSLLASSRITEGKIFAFEPSPKILRQLHENINLNQKEKAICVVEKAVSNKKGTIDFNISDNPDYNHISYLKDSSSIKVATTTLDRFITDHNLKHIKIVKIDVEGAEFMVLKGFINTLQQGRVDVLIVEINEGGMNRFGVCILDITNFLTGFGYNIFMFNKNFKLIRFSADKSKGWNLIAVLGNKDAIVKSFNSGKLKPRSSREA